MCNNSSKYSDKQETDTKVVSSGAFERENWNHTHLMVRDMLRLVLGEALGWALDILHTTQHRRQHCSPITATRQHHGRARWGLPEIHGTGAVRLDHPTEAGGVECGSGGSSSALRREALRTNSEGLGPCRTNPRPEQGESGGTLATRRRSWLAGTDSVAEMGVMVAAATAAAACPRFWLRRCATMSAFTCRSSFASCTASFIASFSSLRFPTLRRRNKSLDALRGGFSCTPICDCTEAELLKNWRRLASFAPLSFLRVYDGKLPHYPLTCGSRGEEITTIFIVPNRNKRAI